MNTEIKAFAVSNLHQAEDYTFHSIALAAMETCTDEHFQAVKADYKAKFEAFDLQLKKSGGTDPDTKGIAEADAATDSCYVGMAACARAMRNHFNPLTAEVARRYCIILDRYGNPTSLSYLEEYGVIDNLLQDLTEFDTTPISLPDTGNTGGGEEDRPGELSLLADDETHNLATIGMDEWMVRLKECRDRFMEAFIARNTRIGQSEAGLTKAARQAADTAYRAAVKRLNALIELNGPEAYAAIVGDINALIDRQKSVIASRTTRNAKKKAESNTPDDERPGEL